MRRVQAEANAGHAGRVQVVTRGYVGFHHQDRARQGKRADFATFGGILSTTSKPTGFSLK